jgi:hypothetical protein
MNSIKLFSSLVAAEYLKTRKTWAFWLSIFGGMIIPLIVFLVVRSHPEIVQNRMNSMPWYMFLKFNWQSVATFLLPLYVVLSTSLIVQIEHRANAFKKILTLPHPRGSFYLAKLVVILYYVIITHIIFVFSIVVFGLLLGSIHPDTMFLEKAIPWEMMLRQITKSFIASLGIVAIQYLLSIRFKNFIKPIGLGFATTLAGSIMLLGWEYVDYWPWSLPAKVSPGIMQGASNQIFTMHEWISLGYFGLFGIIGILYFSYRNIK